MRHSLLYSRAALHLTFLCTQRQQNDAGILEAIQLGFNLGQSSPSATGLVSYLNDTQSVKMAELDDHITTSLDETNAAIQEAADKASLLVFSFVIV